MVGESGTDSADMMIVAFENRIDIKNILRYVCCLSMLISMLMSN